MITLQSIISAMRKHAEKGYQTPDLIRIHPKDLRDLLDEGRQQYNYNAFSKVLIPGGWTIGGMHFQGDNRVKEGEVEFVNREKLFEEAPEKDG